MEIRSRLDFEVPARGWCYLLEAHGLAKSDFDKAAELIADCRKSGHLPLDICAADASREYDGIQQVDTAGPAQEADNWIYTLRTAYRRYAPVGFWDDQPYYLQLLVEKIDLKSLFADICDEYFLPRANSRGWGDLNGRSAMMRRFEKAEQRGQAPVLLYCGDLDPAGLLISDFLRSNIEDLAEVIGWHPMRLEIDRPP